MASELEHLIVTGGGFLGTSLSKHFENRNGHPLRTWTAGRTGSKNSLTSIVIENNLKNFGVILSGWSGVTSGYSMDAEIQNRSLRDFEQQLEEVTQLRPQVTLGFGSQIEKLFSAEAESGYVSRYAEAKATARKKFQEAMISADLVGRWIYIYSVYGPGMEGGWLLPQLIKASNQGKPFLMGTCTQKWGLLHISDFCSAIDLIVSEPSSFPLEIDVGGEANQTLRDLVIQVEATLGNSCAIFEDRPTPTGDSVPDLRALRGRGWQQRVALSQGVIELKDLYV